MTQQSPPPSPKGKRLSKTAKIVISLIVVVSLILGSIYIIYLQIESSAESSAVKQVEILNSEPKWVGTEENVVNPPPQWWLDPTYDLYSYIAITIKNPTQYQVFIKIHGYLNMTIIKNGQSVGNFNPDATQTFSLSPYSEDAYALRMPSSYSYLHSDNMTVTFISYSISELYRGTTAPPS
jgi:hypothetical protein